MSAADPTATLYQHLQSSGLLTDAQLRDLFGWIAHKKPDLQALAREIDLAAANVFGFAGERCDRIVAAVRARLRELDPS